MKAKKLSPLDEALKRLDYAKGHLRAGETFNAYDQICEVERILKEKHEHRNTK